MISGVPEGKGVSSSAAIEVATMSALAASHGKKKHAISSDVRVENIVANTRKVFY